VAEWARGLLAWGKPVTVRAAAVAAGLRLRYWEDVHGDSAAPEVAAAVVAVEAWVANPGESERRAAGRAADFRLRSAWLPVHTWRLRAVVFAAASAAAARHDLQAGRLAAAAVALADCTEPGAPQRAAKRASLGRGRVRHALRRALVPWALSPDSALTLGAGTDA